MENQITSGDSASLPAVPDTKEEEWKLQHTDGFHYLINERGEVVAPIHLNYATDILRAVNASVQRVLEKTKAFKDFVHRRLDTAGVPKEFPDGEHTKEGCRIGDRLDWVLEKKETGGRNALNLQVEISSFLTAIINSERDFLLPCGSRLQHATANLLDALRSAQAASDGKERGERGKRPSTIEELRSLIGEPPEGSHPDEWFPRSETWHLERVAWEAEVGRLRGVYRPHPKDTGESKESGGQS